MKSEGLRRVPTERLQRLLRMIHKEQLVFPLTRSGLIAGAMGDFEQHLDLLIGLDKRAAQNVVVAVLAERRVSSLE
jgi:hypothetical protein